MWLRRLLSRIWSFLKGLFRSPAVRRGLDLDAPYDLDLDYDLDGIQEIGGSVILSLKRFGRGIKPEDMHLSVGLPVPP